MWYEKVMKFHLIPLVAEVDDTTNDELTESTGLFVCILLRVICTILHSLLRFKGSRLIQRL